MRKESYDGAAARKARRAVIAESVSLIGLDFVEAVPNAEKSTHFALILHFIPPAPGVSKRSVPDDIELSRMKVSSAVSDLSIRSIDRREEHLNLIKLTVSWPADARPEERNLRYRVEVIGSVCVDPFFSRATFLLPDYRRSAVPMQRDCRPRSPEAASQEIPAPEVDYLAKDYSTFRQEVMQHMTSWMPGWKERNPSDLGVALVEILAYAGDYLSYNQDAVATESYLSTARRRLSIRRHARLFDYYLQEGCNSRTWVQVQVSGNAVAIPAGTQFLAMKSPDSVVVPDPHAWKQTADSDIPCFEAMHTAVLYEEHNCIPIYTWGSPEFLLPRGTTHVTLGRALPELRAGDVLVLEQNLDPNTGEELSASNSSRQAVRIRTQPQIGVDWLYRHPITEIEWYEEDALQFDLIVTRSKVGLRENNIAVASANMLLADFGCTNSGPDLPPVLDCGPYYPRINVSQLCYAGPADLNRLQSARQLLRQNPGEALPSIRLFSSPPSQILSREEWTPRHDLFGSSSFARHFVAENDGARGVFLRFGDGQLGRKPSPGLSFGAQWRNGNGSAGNVGAETINTVVTCNSHITRVRNPLPAIGGLAPESLQRARLFAPVSFKSQRRCVIEQDYRDHLLRFPTICNCALVQSQSGTGPVDVVYIQRRQFAPLTDEFVEEVSGFLEGFRLLGRRIELRAPQFVPLDIALAATVENREEIMRGLPYLEQRLLSLISPDGNTGLCGADSFTFGQHVFLSAFLANASNLPGMQRIEVTQFAVWGRPDRTGLTTGQISIAKNEIARLDNDPTAPENGLLSIGVAVAGQTL